MPADYVHLHVYSSYSFLRGLASPAELASAAAAAGMPALALTDHVGLSGAVEFYEACRAEGVQPVLGLELPVALPQERGGGLLPGNGLVFLAEENAGWRSLCRLSSAALAGGAGAPQAVSFETLAEEAKGLLCLSGGRNGLLANLLRSGQEQAAARLLGGLKEIFGRRVYVELFNHGQEDVELCERLYLLSRRQALPAAAAHAVCYLGREQSRLAQLAAAVRLNVSITEVPEMEAPPPEAYFVSARQMQEKFAAYPETLEVTADIARRCRVELPLDQPHFPKYSLPLGTSATELLRERAHRGAQRLYGVLTQAIEERLERELEVIGEAGYADIFLVMEEILQHARETGVPHASRGSAASSLVAHCLGITTPDPLRLNLYFERFLNPARSKPPDIDTDLCSRRRDEVIRFVYRRYGAERVAMVCTINRFRRRSALRETAKAHGLPPQQVSELAEAVQGRGWGPPGRRSDQQAPYQELAERYPSPLYQRIFQDAAALIGLPRHLSVHPGGVVIAPVPLTDLAPTLLASKGMVITQFDLEAIERLGLVKIDLLGIRGLTVLGDLARAMQEQVVKPRGRKPARQASALEHLEAIPLEDEPTARAVREGRTIGCFQIESPGMRATLKEIQADSVDDLMAALALFRPGPLTGGLKDAFVRRFRGEEAPSHLHSSLAPILDETYGVILYQEQVLRIAHELAGLSLADADLLRRAMSHFDPGQQMEKLKERFVKGAARRAGMAEALAGRIWEMMAAFAGYGFPKAHAASYAVVAWRAAWCKTHHPALFMAAVLANWGGYYGQRVYIMEARRLGLTLRPPHVNYARREFSAHLAGIEDGSTAGQMVLFMGLEQVRDLTRRAQSRIIIEQPFRSLEDFLARVDPRPVEAENLARVGALEGFGSIPAVLRRLKGGWRGGQLPLFALETDQTEQLDWSMAEKAAAQQEILGVSVDVHPLELAAARIGEALTTVEAAGQVGRKIRIAGMRQSWRRSRTVQGDRVYFMSFEDLEGMLNVVIPDMVYRLLRGGMSGPGPYILEGTVELDPTTAEPYIRAERIERA